MKKSHIVTIIITLAFVLLVGCEKPLKANKNVVFEDVKLASISGPIKYENNQYGFNFALPESWNGYKIVDSYWEGMSIGGQNGETIVQRGPIVLIRHPKWTEQSPRLDIPIMIFTQDQWSSLQKEEFHIGAAPIGPSKLDENSKYVFALPARYNFSFLPGYKDVENILKENPLKAK